MTSSKQTLRQVGSGSFVYQEIKDWAQFPQGWTTEDGPAVAVDSSDRVYALIRNRNGLLCFERDGLFRGSWGEDLFVRPHGLFIAPDDSIFVVDDWGHSVYRFTPEGRQLMCVETRDHPAETGYLRTRQPVQRAGPPFNEPTGCALSPEGEIYVTDGYGNARVHKFTSEGELMLSWGEPGSGPGQFLTPHGVLVDQQGLVYVSDRMNGRVQIFDSQGRYQSEWSDAHYPNNVCMDADGNRYVAEISGFFLYGPQPRMEEPEARITVRDETGKILSQWGEQDPRGSGRFFAPHSIAVDSRGDLYVTEVTHSYSFGTAPADWGVLRKYVRVRNGADERH